MTTDDDEARAVQEGLSGLFRCQVCGSMLDASSFGRLMNPLRAYDFPPLLKRPTLDAVGQPHICDNCWLCSMRRAFTVKIKK